MSSAAAGPFAAVALLLVIAGVAKLARPRATVAALAAAGFRAHPLVGRAIGVGEIALAAAAVLSGSRPLALVVAAVYLAFAAFTIRIIARSGGKADCGCFGAAQAPATNAHVALNLGAAAIAATAAAFPPGTLASVLGDQPLAGVPFVALVLLCTWLGLTAYTLLPDLHEARR